jgi:hypothetical protein
VLGTFKTLERIINATQEDLGRLGTGMLFIHVPYHCLNLDLAVIWMIISFTHWLEANRHLRYWIDNLITYTGTQLPTQLCVPGLDPRRPSDSIKFFMRTSRESENLDYHHLRSRTLNPAKCTWRWCSMYYVRYRILWYRDLILKPFSENDEIKMTGALQHLLIFLHLASKAARGKLGKNIKHCSN